VDSCWQPAMVKLRWPLYRLATVILALSAACGPYEFGLARRVVEDCPTATADARFFNGVFEAGADTRQARTEGYAELLDTLGLQSLACGNAVDEGYRLIYVPQQDESLVISAARVAAQRQLTTLRVRNSDKTIQRSTSRSLSGDEWRHLSEALGEFDFWIRPPYPTPAGSTHTRTVVHGSAWVIEARDMGWYHALSRVSNAREGDFDGVAEALFRLAGLEVPGEFRSSRF
jgi:hypothetical protein